MQTTIPAEKKRRGPKLSINLVREQKIIDLVKQRKTLDEIAELIGVGTRARIGQIISVIIERRGKDVFKRGIEDENFWDIDEIAKMLRVPVDWVQRLCRCGQIPSTRSKKVRVIGEEGMEALLKHPRIAGRLKCRICGVEFAYSPCNRPRRDLCSDECERQYHRWRRDPLKNKGLSSRPTGWLKILWQVLLDSIIPENEEWLTVTEAAKLSGLGIMQVIWLGIRGVVITRPQPKKMYRGRPMVTYAKSQIEIAGRVFKEYKQRNALAKREQS